MEKKNSKQTLLLIRREQRKKQRKKLDYFFVTILLRLIKIITGIIIKFGNPKILNVTKSFSIN